MDRYFLAASIILFSVTLGSIAAVVHNSEPVENNAVDQPGEVHEHALFHVVRNETEVNFSREKFQLNSRAVHLENNISDIVHRHRSRVTWSQFLQTINVEVWTSNATGNLCLSVGDKTNCGDGKVVLNGEEVQSLESVIEQDDHLLIIQDTVNQTAVIDEYMKQQLPPEYKPESRRGRQV